MMLNNLDKSDLLSILDILLKEMEQPFFIVDSIFRIKYFNHAFSKFVAKEPNTILDVDFGEALGCGNMIKDHKNCAFTSFCGHCEIRKNLHLVFNKQQDKVQFELVREFVINGEILTRHVQMSLLQLVIEQNRQVICLISDKGDKDLIQLLTQPQSVI